VDDFYNDPHETREFALQQEFNVVGNYPGFRSKPFYNQSVVNLIQDIVYFSGGKITNWATDEYKHKETGIYTAPLKNDGTYDYETLDKLYLDSQDMTKWEMTDMLGNKFNRLILYRADYFHTSLDYFGRNLQDGRLFQTFFFDTER